MKNLTETIGNMCNYLEDAIEEHDWDIVKRITSQLSDLYDALDRADYDY